MWSILENVPCALEKKVYSPAFGWNVLKISMRAISCNVSFMNESDWAQTLKASAPAARDQTPPLAGQ